MYEQTDRSASLKSLACQRRSRSQQRYKISWPAPWQKAYQCAPAVSGKPYAVVRFGLLKYIWSNQRHLVIIFCQGTKFTKRIHRIAFSVLQPASLLTNKHMMDKKGFQKASFSLSSSQELLQSSHPHKEKQSYWSQMIPCYHFGNNTDDIMFSQ